MAVWRHSGVRKEVLACATVHICERGSSLFQAHTGRCEILKDVKGHLSVCLFGGGVEVIGVKHNGSKGIGAFHRESGGDR